jgi:hypothetical protein
MSISEKAAAYVESRGEHWAGTMWRHQIETIERNYSKHGFSVETGCGASTVLLSNLSSRHLVFCYDDREQHNGDPWHPLLDETNSSVGFVLSAPAFNASTTEFIFGATQATLPKFKFTEKIDLGLIDGPHAFPFAQLEYYFIYPHLREGALLIIDDIHIPTIHNLFSFLKEDKMFTLVDRVAETAFFRRTDAPTFNPFGDGWEFQEYNKRRFPIKSYSGSDLLSHYTPESIARLIPKGLRNFIKGQAGKLQISPRRPRQ